MGDEFLGKMLSQSVGVWQILEYSVVDFFVTFLCYFPDVNKLMVAQRVIVDFLIDISSVAV